MLQFPWKIFAMLIGLCLLDGCSKPVPQPVSGSSHPIGKAVTDAELKGPLNETYPLSQKSQPSEVQKGPQGKSVRLDQAVDIVEFARSKGLDNVDALTLIRQAGNSNHVLAGHWKLTTSNITCANGSLEGSPGVPVTDDSELWLCARIPFRVYLSKDSLGESMLNSIHGARTVVAAKHEIYSQPYFLTTNSSLRPCSVRDYQAFLLSGKTDNIFYGESERTQVLIAGRFNSQLRTMLKNRQPLKGYSIVIYFRDLVHCDSRAFQASWGFYRSGALREYDWDSDQLMTWNATGALTGVVPDYFHTDPAKSPVVTCALLSAIQLLDPAGHVLASADWDLTGW